MSVFTELRILKRVVGETFKGLSRTKLVNIVIIGTMAAILTIFGCLLRTSLGLSNFVDKLGNVLEISAYLDEDANASIVSNRIKKYKFVKKVKVISKDTAWNDLKKQMEIPDVSNPLPDTLRIKVDHQLHIPSVIERVKRTSGVEDIQYSKDLAQKMQKVNDITNFISFAVIVILGSLTLFVINNTIHLVIQSRTKEVEIMRMMGVSNWYIRMPYMLQGAFYGFAGAMVAIIPLNIVHTQLNNFFMTFQINSSMLQNNIVVVSILSMGIIMGGMGSAIAMRKHLRI